MIVMSDPQQNIIYIQSRTLQLSSLLIAHELVSDSDLQIFSGLECSPVGVLYRHTLIPSVSRLSKLRYNFPNVQFSLIYMTVVRIPLG